MRVKVQRRLSLDEVAERLAGFERSLGLSFEEFEDRLLAGLVSQEQLGTYVEWAALNDAYRAYEESGELDYVVEDSFELEERALERLLSPRRLELLVQLAARGYESMNDLARRIRRDPKNVYEDLKALEKLRLVRLRRAGSRNVVPETPIEELTFVIR